MFSWLPYINHEFPGAGITPFNVWALTFDWWRVYRARTREIFDERKAASARRGR